MTEPKEQFMDPEQHDVDQARQGMLGIPDQGLPPRNVRGRGQNNGEGPPPNPEPPEIIREQNGLTKEQLIAFFSV